MNIEENVSLADHSTMRLGGRARYLVDITSEEQLPEIVHWARQKSLPFRIIGHGSNIVWRDEGFEGLIIVNKIFGFEVVNRDDDSALIKVNGGEKWDDAVAQTVSMDLSGIEFLSAIPGTAGAAPVQNIGAYGAEIADALTEVRAFDTKENEFVNISAQECHFSYRNSRFKNIDRGRFMITAITMRLVTKNPSPPFYESLQSYFDEHEVTDFTPAGIREAVIAIRKIKLPDPSVVNNNGSFFTNPIVPDEKFQQLKNQYPDIKGWPASDGKIKLSAGWMVEQAGFKGIHDAQTGMATWPDSALVLVNENARRTQDLIEFRQKILNKIHQMFGVDLEQEPELLP